MTITTDDLPEALRKLFLEIGQTHQSLTVIHEGNPIVTISSVLPKKPRPAFGFMQGQGEILADIMAPVEQPWEVLQ